MTPDDLLEAARRLVAEGTRSGRGLWARAAATLARQAVEARVEELLQKHAPGAQSTPMRNQLLCLCAVLPDREHARRLAYVWYRLSSALHHHAYELPPTAAELTGWIAAIEPD